MSPRKAFHSGRAGFALLPVLSIVVGGAALAVVLVGITRDAAAASENRIALRRAEWRAEGCTQALMSRATDQISIAEPAASGNWRSLDSAIAGPPEVQGGCECSLTAFSSALPINLASERQLHALFQSAGFGDAEADSLAAAVADWRDSDDVARPAGAESVWYSSRSRARPRNGPMDSAAELALVRGFGDPRVPWHDLSADNSRVFLARASDEVLGALFELRAADVHAMRLQAGRASRVSDFRSGPAVARPPFGGAPGGSASEPRVEATDDPDGWEGTCSASDGVPPVTATVRVRLVRSGPRVALVRRVAEP